jgi:hypothetical protein
MSWTRHDDRLMAEADSAAERLRPVCPNFPDERFRDLVFDVALARLHFEMNRPDYERLRAAFVANRAAYVARLGRNHN